MKGFKMYSCIKKIAISTAAAALFMGNITPPTQNNFYEDDRSFHHVAKTLTSGWGWGFNKAYACGDETDYADCWITTTPEPWGDDWNDDWDYDFEDEFGEDPYDNDSGAGGGNEPSEQEQVIAYTQCILDANKSFDTCITSAKNTINTLHNACLAASGILGLAVKHALPVILGTLACNEAKDYDLEHVSDDDGTCATTRGEDRKDCE